MKKVLLTAIAAVAVLATSAQAVDYDFDVNPNATWLGWINTFNVSDDTAAFGFGEGDLTTASGNFAAGPSQPLTLGPNTRLYDENIADPVWVDQITFQPNLYTEFNMYQEGIAAVGDTFSFDFQSISSTLPAGYEVRAFLKVLDGFASWATTQYNWVDITTPGAATSLSATVASPGAGTPFIQAGFSITGAIVSASDPAATTGIEIIPEPATIGLMGIAGLGMFVARRRLKI